MKRLSAAIKLKTLFEQKLLPWSQPGVLRWVVARPTLQELALPTAVEVRPRVMCSRAASHRVPRQYRNTSLMVRRWADDHLSALRVSKIACVTSGCATFELGEYELRMPAGTFLFIPAGTPQPDGTLSHWREPAPAPPCDVCWIQPHGNQLHLWLCRSSERAHALLPWSNIFLQVRRPTQYFSLLHDETLCDGQKSPLITGHLLTLLLLEMQREIEDERFLRLSNREEVAPPPVLPSDPIAAAIQFLDTNFESAITLASLAREVGMSRSQLARRFHEQTGRTVVEHLTEKRLEHACKLLRETEWTITHIVGFVGLRSAAHFYTLFRKRFGSSPAAYRRKHSSNRDDGE